MRYHFRLQILDCKLPIMAYQRALTIMRMRFLLAYTAMCHLARPKGHHCGIVCGTQKGASPVTRSGDRGSGMGDRGMADGGWGIGDRGSAALE